VAVDPRASWLEAFIRAHRGAAGTVHEARGESLSLVAAFNIPEKVQQLTAVIPKGKGMGGLAFERNAPVSTCNLQTDGSGAVRPGARAVDAQAAVAFPVHDGAGAIRAIVGIAFAGERTLDDAELAQLTAAGQSLPDGPGGAVER
jgi:L-methionine (R)-S-oxide reductase